MVRRADGSGTSFIFTNYLSKVNPEWKAKVGEGTAVNWPVGAGGKGNEGVAAFVGRLPNSIGYVEYAYVKQNKMTYALLRNKEGNFVSPSDVAFKAAAAELTGLEQDLLSRSRPTSPAKDAWPISNPTFILMHKVQDKPANATSVLKFFDWAVQRAATRWRTNSTTCRCRRPIKELVHKHWAANLKDTAGKSIAPQLTPPCQRAAPARSPDESRRRYARYTVPPLLRTTRTRWSMEPTPRAQASRRSRRRRIAVGRDVAFSALAHGAALR